MINFKGETYLLAKEAAEYLSISRQTFYVRYRKHLNPKRIGEKMWKLYALTDLEAINRVHDLPMAS